MEKRRDAHQTGSPGRPSVHILLIDDDEQAREAVRRVAERDVAPVEIREVVNHVGFYQALQENRFDLVITEQDLHWSTGREVLTAIKSLRPGAPVIMVASKENEKAEAEALREGLDAYLVKADGFSGRLRACLRAALRGIESEARIESLEEELRDLMDRLDVGVFEATPDGTVLRSNAAFERMTGRDRESAGDEVSLKKAYLDSSLFTQLMDQLRTSTRVRADLARWRDPDGGERWVSVSATLRPAPGGEPVVHGIVEDVTHEQAAREAADRATQDLRAIFESSGAAVAVLRADGSIEMVNTAFERFSGFARGELEGVENWSRFMSIADGQHDAERRRVLLAAPGSGPRGGRFDFIARDGRSFRVDATEAALPDGERSVVSLVNITERQRVEDRLMHNVFHDGLTGLPNRLSLMDRLGALADGSQSDEGVKTGVLVLDVDDFKSANDHYGCRIGDLLLRSVTRRVEGAADGAHMVGRTGSDGFAVILHPVENREAVAEIAEAVMRAFEDPFQFGEHSIHCTVSMGAALARTPAEVADLHRHAESAMYEARRAGGARWRWHGE